jgi:hypothetical protein
MKNMGRKMENKRPDVCEAKIYSRDLHEDLMNGCCLRFGCNLFCFFLLTSLVNQGGVWRVASIDIKHTPFILYLYLTIYLIQNISSNM